MGMAVIQVITTVMEVRVVAAQIRKTMMKMTMTETTRNQSVVRELVTAVTITKVITIMTVALVKINSINVVIMLILGADLSLILLPVVHAMLQRATTLPTKSINKFLYTSRSVRCHNLFSPHNVKVITTTLLVILLINQIHH